MSAGPLAGGGHDEAVGPGQDGMMGVPARADPPAPDEGRASDSGADGQSLVIQIGGLGVDNPLPRAAMKSASMMPPVLEVPVGGMITTDRYAARATPNKQRKLNVYVFGRQIRPDSVRGAVYSQQLDKDGHGIDLPPERAESTGLRNAIVVRARQSNTAQ